MRAQDERAHLQLSQLSPPTPEGEHTWALEDGPGRGASTSSRDSLRARFGRLRTTAAALASSSTSSEGLRRPCVVSPCTRRYCALWASRCSNATPRRSMTGGLSTRTRSVSAPFGTTTRASRTSDQVLSPWLQNSIRAVGSKSKKLSFFARLTSPAGLTRSRAAVDISCAWVRQYEHVTARVCDAPSTIPGPR